MAHRTGRAKDPDLRKEAVKFATELAQKLRLSDRLPEDTDLENTEEAEITEQLIAWFHLPPPAKDMVWDAFLAGHLVSLVSALKTLSLETQPLAYSILIQILFRVDEAKSQPYMRKFLRDHPEARGLPNLVAQAFLNGLRSREPSGSGRICGLLCDLLLWCDPSQGDDKKASIDSTIRMPLEKFVQKLKESPTFPRRDLPQRADIERLLGILDSISWNPEDYYVKSSRDWLVGSTAMDDCPNIDCEGEEATMMCSRCKTVRYCSAKCQNKHWKEGHKLHCFQVPA